MPRADRRGRCPPLGQNGDEIGERRAVDQPHHRVRHSLAGIDAAQRPADAILDDKVCERDDDFLQQERSQDDGPQTLPGDRGSVPKRIA